MATDSSTLACRIPLTAEPGRLQSWDCKSWTWLNYCKTTKLLWYGFSQDILMTPGKDRIIKFFSNIRVPPSWTIFPGPARVSIFNQIHPSLADPYNYLSRCVPHIKTEVFDTVCWALIIYFCTEPPYSCIKSYWIIGKIVILPLF